MPIKLLEEVLDVLKDKNPPINEPIQGVPNESIVKKKS
jgi:hypothetical protein